MKNKFIDKMYSRVLVEINGPSIDRLIVKLNRKKINIFKLDKINKNKAQIIIYYNDYEKLLKLNTIYEIKIVNYYGIIKRKKQFFKYIHVLFAIIFSIIALYLLSNVIFKVEIITTDEDMKKKLTRSLKQYDISEYHFKKNYNYLENIKKKLLEEYHDNIEWIEIENVGTKYIVRYEPRIIKENNEDSKYRSVIAKKNAIIKKIYSSEGQIVKDKYSYVKKGDIIISGYVYANEKVKGTVKATGTVYGEVWYITKVVYPFNYYEQTKTGRKKNVFSVKLFNNSIELFNFEPFNDKIVSEKVLIRNNLLPIMFTRQHQEEVIIKTGMDAVEGTKINAVTLAYDKINNSLGKDEYIIDYKVLDSKIIDKGVEMKIFFSVCENIGEYVEISEMKEVEE